MRTIGLIGLGLLGSAIAGRLRRAGFSVLGWDTSQRQREALVADGGRASDSALAAAQACRQIVLALPDSAVVASVLAEIQPALTPEVLIIDTTTGDPWAAERVGATIKSGPPPAWPPPASAASARARAAERRAAADANTIVVR